MRLLILAALLLLELSALAQKVVPNRRKNEAGSSVPDYRTGLSYQWVASDLASPGYVSTDWTDRVQKATMKIYDNSYRPWRQYDGIWFGGGNAFSNTITTLSAPYTLWIVMEPDLPLGPAQPNDGSIVEGLILGSQGSASGLTLTSGGNLRATGVSLGNTLSSALVFRTNIYNIGVSTDGSCYTNGVQSTSGLWPSGNLQFDRVGEMGGAHGISGTTRASFRGWIYEIRVYTNTPSSANYATLNTYATTVYKTARECPPGNPVSEPMFFWANATNCNLLDNSSSLVTTGNRFRYMHDFAGGSRFDNGTNGPLFSSTGGANNQGYFAFTNENFFCDSTSVGPAAIAQPTHWFFVFNSDSGGAGGGNVFDGLNNREIFEISTSDHYIYAGGFVQQTVAWPFAGSAMLVTALFNSSSSYFRTNGVQVKSGNASTSAIGSIVLGSDNAHGHEINMRLSEIMAYSVALTSNEQYSVENYLTAKLGPFPN